MNAGGDEKARPLYMIGVAAELAGMHPQTLRIYERKRLVCPERSSGNTRLYSEADVERLRFIQRLTHDEGVNLAGVERMIELLREMEDMRDELERTRHSLEEARTRFERETRRIHRSYKAEMVLVPRGGLIKREQR